MFDESSDSRMKQAKEWVEKKIEQGVCPRCRRGLNDLKVCQLCKSEYTHPYSSDIYRAIQNYLEYLKQQQRRRGAQCASRGGMR